MYLFYIDETGNRDPRLLIPKADGTTIQGDWLYVLTAVGLYEHKWHGFEKPINRQKRGLIQRIRYLHGVELELADCEIKSNWLRQPKERGRHPLLSRLREDEIKGLVNFYFDQLDRCGMTIFSVLVDKRYLPSYMDMTKLHRKSWEILLEQIEGWMRRWHDKHQAIMIVDDVDRQMNRSLAMKHAHILDQGTHRDTWLRHICEMPMFVRSELSNGVQLADLCGYNIYRAFKTADLKYPFFDRISNSIWCHRTPLTFGQMPFRGLYVYPSKSPLRALARELQERRTPVKIDRGSKMVSGGVNPIEPTSGTGRDSSEGTV